MGSSLSMFPSTLGKIALHSLGYVHKLRVFGSRDVSTTSQQILDPAYYEENSLHSRLLVHITLQMLSIPKLEKTTILQARYLLPNARRGVSFFEIFLCTPMKARGINIQISGRSDIFNVAPPSAWTQSIPLLMKRPESPMRKH